MAKTITLGPKVIVTDPGYEPSNGHNRTLSVRPGEYVCSAARTNIGTLARPEHRIKFISIRHIDCLGQKAKYDELEAIAAVDSGQLGFFDAGYYENHYADDDYDNPESWYRKVCDLTVEKDYGAVDGKGFVSSSGLGDGCYGCYGWRDRNGDIVGLIVTFLD